MKKLIPFISTLLLAGKLMAATTATVMVNTNTGIVTYPTNFFAANGISSTTDVSALTVRVTSTESVNTTQTVAIVASTNATRIVADRVTILETNTATKAQGIAATNAQVRVAALEANGPNSGSFLTVTGNVTALTFIGNGSGLSNVTSVVTGGVNSITMGGSNFTGNVTILGTGLTYTGPGTATVYRVDYSTRNIVLATNIYEMTMDGPRDEEMIITNIFSKVDAYNATFDVVSAPAGSTWRADQTTLISGIVATDTGTMTPCYLVIPTNTEWGVKMTDYDPRTTQLRVRYKTVFQ